MSGRITEAIGDIRGHVEFAAESIEKRWEENPLYHILYPHLQQPLAANDILSSVNFEEVEGNKTKYKPGLIDRGYMYVINGKKGDRPEFARSYWLDKGMPSEEVNKLVDADGRIKFHIKPSEYRRLIGKLNPLKAAITTIDTLAPLYDNNTYPLDASIPGVDGFNAHQRPHIKTVAQGADELMLQAKQLGFRKITRNDRIVATRGAVWHDIANIQSRRLHAKGAPLLMDNVVPSDKEDPLLERVKAVMVFHNEPELRELLSSRTDGSAKQGIELLSQLDPAILAVILADKLHIGQDRLPPNWTQSEGILRDWDIGINAAFNIESAGFVGKKIPGRRSRYQDAGKFVVNLKYNETFEDDYFTPRLGHNLTQPSSRYPNGRIDLPDAIQAYIPNATHSEVLEAMLWKRYQERLRLTLMTAFAFNPNAQTVEININDPDAMRGLTKHMKNLLSADELERRIQEVSHRHYTFTPNNIDQQISAIQQKFVDKGIDLEDLKREGQALLPPADVA